MAGPDLLVQPEPGLVDRLAGAPDGLGDEQGQQRSSTLSPGVPAARKAACQTTADGTGMARSRPSAAPAGIARKNAANTRPRIRRGKMSTRSVSAMTVAAAPPAPAIARAAWIWTYDRASPVPTTARLLAATLMARSRGRRYRSARYPAAGLVMAAAMSSTVASHPASPSSSPSSELTRGETEAISQPSAESMACIANTSARTPQAHRVTAMVPERVGGTSRRPASAVGPVLGPGAGSAVGSGPGPGSWLA